MVVDLLGVVPGDGNVAEQAAEQAGASVGDLVQGALRFGELGEDRQQSGAGRRFQNDVAGGQRSGLGGDKAECQRRRELLEVFGFLRAAGLRREPPGNAGQHLEHRHGRTGARTHRAAEFAQEQDLGRFEGLVGVFPHPRPFGIGAAERGLHRRPQRAAVEGTALPEQLRQQRRSMKKPRDLVGRGLRQKQRQRDRGGCKAEHAGDLRERGSDEPGQALSLLRPGFTRLPAALSLFALALGTAVPSNKKGPRGGGPGFGSFQAAAVEWRHGSASGVPPRFRSPDHVDQRARPEVSATAAPVPVFRKCASGRRCPVERDAGRLVLGQEGRQFGRREVDFGRLGPARIGNQRCCFGALRIRRSVVRGSVGIGYARRQPDRGGLARRPVETEAGGAFRGIEGGFERRGEFRLFVAGVIASPAIAEDFPADREAVRLFDPAPVIGGGRPPEIGERDREPPPRGFNDRIGRVLDRQLRLEAEGDARKESMPSPPAAGGSRRCRSSRPRVSFPPILGFRAWSRRPKRHSRPR